MFNIFLNPIKMGISQMFFLCWDCKAMEVYWISVGSSTRFPSIIAGSIVLADVSADNCPC